MQKSKSFSRHDGYRNADSSSIIIALGKIQNFRQGSVIKQIPATRFQKNSVDSLVHVSEISAVKKRLRERQE